MSKKTLEAKKRLKDLVAEKAVDLEQRKTHRKDRQHADQHVQRQRSL
jgi:hypothetical protein